MRTRSLARGLAQAGALASVILTAQVAINLRQVRSPTADPVEFGGESVSVLLPVRDEEARVEACLAALLAQQGVEELEIIVLDDGSTDTTAAIVQRMASSDARVKVLDGDDDLPPAGWRGKTWACHRLAEAASGSVLVFVDADVILAPYAVASAASTMRRLDMQLVSPYPRQIAVSPLERLTQPLVTWSWIATLPMVFADRGPSMFAAAIGQFLVVDAGAFRATGGHAAVSAHIVEDVAVLRAMKRAGYRGIPLDGSQLAQCRMYTGALEVYEGYCKSLWAVFGSTLGAVGGVGAMTFIYLIPPLVAVTSRDRAARRWGMLGYASAVAGRALVAHRTGERLMPDVLAQPASVGAFAALTVASVIRHRRGSLSWKRRSV